MQGAVQYGRARMMLVPGHDAGDWEKEDVKQGKERRRVRSGKGVQCKKKAQWRERGAMQRKTRSGDEGAMHERVTVSPNDSCLPGT